MKPVSTFANFPEFANAGARTAPESGKYAAGFVPADTLPAEWANYFFHGATKGISDLNAAVYSIWLELASILASYGVTADGAESSQLLDAITRIYPKTAECTTAAEAALKSVAVQSFTLKTGCSLIVKMTNANSYGDGSDTWPSLSVNSGTAYPMCDASGNPLRAGAWDAGDTVTLVFTGEKFIANTPGASDKIAFGNLKPVTGDAVARLVSGTREIESRTPRFLRFSPSNRKALVIKGGTTIIVGAHLYSAAQDATYDLSGESLSPGADYYVYLNWSEGDAWTLSASAQKMEDTDSRLLIGRFHTLCAAVPSGTNMTMAAPPSSGIVVGNRYLVKPYREDEDFFSLYNKEVLAISTGGYYDVITLAHPLAGFSAGDILPESVWCKTFRPDTLFDDAMCYDPSTGRAIDIYLQSGKGRNTRSRFNAVHTVSRPQICHEDDMLQVGKVLLSDEEFQSAALGSNEGTNIQGSADASTTGGHSDTNGRRMISAIGAEEMCGYLWQWLRDVSALGSGKAWSNISNPSGENVGNTGWISMDGQDAMGGMYMASTALRGGGHWDGGSLCGSRSRVARNARSNVDARGGGRGSSRVITR